jgi:hypothetical protein
MRRQTWAALTLALSAQLSQAKAQDLTTYLEASGTPQKTRSDAGLSMQGDRLRIRAGVALQATQDAVPTHGVDLQATGSTKVVPNLRSAFTLAKNLDLETGVSFAEWNAHSDTTFNTRLRYRKSLRAFFDELDGSVWRSPDGLTTQSLRLGFHETLGDSGGVSALTISGATTLEATQGQIATLGQPNDSQRVRVETRVAGLMPDFLGAAHTVGFSVEKAAGARPVSASTLTYDQSWTPSPLTNLGLNLQFLRQGYSADDFTPSLGFTWHSKF